MHPASCSAGICVLQRGDPKKPLYPVTLLTLDPASPKKSINP
jgi:hypothetical protein